MKQPDPNSKRSQRRRKRNFTYSRPVRRAMRRLADALRGYEHTLTLPGVDGRGFTKMGAQRHW